MTVVALVIKINWKQSIFLHSSSFLAMLENHKSSNRFRISRTRRSKYLYLDDIFINLNNGYKRIFLKIDTQGYEMKVLKGVEKNIQNLCFTTRTFDITFI